jgi:uncharacterized protein
LAVLFILTATAQAGALEIPKLDAHVMDRAEVLSAQSRRGLERTLSDYERETGHQIVVHTTPSLEGLEIEEYSIGIAEAWKVGQKGLDNGVILTIAPQERDVRIEVGYGLEGVMPDAIAFRIIRDHILPQFRAGDLEAGILTGAGAIMQAAAGEVLPVPERSRRERRGGGGLPIWIWLVFLLFAFGSRGFFFWPFLAGSMLGGRRSGGIAGGFGSGGFGGGFGGGGGGFGGGGASGSW